ncbi:hypothetical protein Fot_22701 [Forsythia ovata]|uniref:Reverse transcriptase N-terminal domain-containing protein n=1 Tax=Forsythia ovata TaxID=205694 RepID=A0ABD1UYG2_9LAMI
MVDMNINLHLPSKYINYFDNSLEIINEAEKAAEKDIWSLIQFTENLHCQHGTEHYSMEILLNKLYVMRMVAELWINRIYALANGLRKLALNKYKMDNQKTHFLNINITSKQLFEQTTIYNLKEFEIVEYKNVSFTV